MIKICCQECSPVGHLALLSMLGMQFVGLAVAMRMLLSMMMHQSFGSLCMVSVFQHVALSSIASRLGSPHRIRHYGKWLLGFPRTLQLSGLRFNVMCGGEMTYHDTGT